MPNTTTTIPISLTAEEIDAAISSVVTTYTSLESYLIDMTDEAFYTEAYHLIEGRVSLLKELHYKLDPEARERLE